MVDAHIRPSTGVARRDESIKWMPFSGWYMIDTATQQVTQYTDKGTLDQLWRLI